MYKMFGKYDINRITNDEGSLCLIIFMYISYVREYTIKIHII